LTQHYSKHTELAKRRSWRRQATDAERTLWAALRAGQLGVRFRRQYSVDAFVLDFYAPQCKLAVEVDGNSHFTSEAVQYDEQRTRHLGTFGIEVVRVTNADVAENLDGVLQAVAQAIRRRTSP